MSDSIPIKPEYRDKPIRSFVIRSGRMTEGQRRGVEEHWPSYGLSLEEGAIDLTTLFGREAPVVVEIGFGMGDSLLQMAKDDPNTDFIGIEVHPPGVGRIVANAGEAGLDNLRVYCADALDVLKECVADASLDRVQLYFPDPWHKKKHNKRRIVQPQFTELVRQKLKIGGVFHMATDWEPYAEAMVEVMNEEQHFKNQYGVGEFAPRPDYRPLTKFEKRGQRLGHGVWDLLYERVS